MFGAGVSEGESSDPLSSYFAAFGTILSSIIGQPSRLVDISEFIVLCAGALAPAFIGLRTWDLERGPATLSATPEDTAPV